jgi:hypothetical protein
LHSCRPFVFVSRPERAQFVMPIAVGLQQMTANFPIAEHTSVSPGKSLATGRQACGWAGFLKYYEFLRISRN